MTDLKKSTATIALITLMSAAPLAALASSGSPQQAVDTDPNESVAIKPVTGDESIASDMETSSPQLSVDADEDEQVASNQDTDGTIADELETSSPVITD